MINKNGEINMKLFRKKYINHCKACNMCRVYKDEKGKTIVCGFMQDYPHIIMGVSKSFGCNIDLNRLN